MNGNVIVIGTDEFFHSGIPGATNLSNNGIAFAANIVGKTGTLPFVELLLHVAGSVDSDPRPRPVRRPRFQDVAGPGMLQ